jgi:sugar/nucleoside kinase (ribokinase family)
MAHTLGFIGVGSPIVDLLGRVDDGFLETIHGAKGGMELIDADGMADLVARTDGKTVRAPGGSAANTTFALARLGMASRFLGKVANDVNGKWYIDMFERLGGDCSHFRTSSDLATAQCISMVTPDSERTMRTYLGAAIQMLPEDVSVTDFTGCSHAHIEGYLLFNRDLMFTVLNAAKQANCQVSLDLASFEVVGASKDILEDLLRNYVDVVFANEQEAAAFSGTADPEAACVQLGTLCSIAAVKLAEKGAWIVRGKEKVRVLALTGIQAVDTTGAGDLWAAGFLYGLINGRTLETCGEYASLLGGEVVQYMGAAIPEERWTVLRKALVAPA